MKHMEVTVGGLDDPDLLTSPNYTHAMAGQQRMSCYRDSRYSPPMGHHMVRSKEMIEATKVRDLPLSSGLSMRVGMGDMDCAIDDGVEGIW